MVVQYMYTPSHLHPNQLMLQLQQPAPSAPCTCLQALSCLQSLSRGCSQGLAFPAHLSISIASLSMSCPTQSSIMGPGPLLCWHGIPAFVVTGVWYIDLFVVWLLHQKLSLRRVAAAHQPVCLECLHLPGFLCCLASLSDGVVDQGASQAAAVPLWAKTVISCTLSQVFLKTWLSYHL